MRAGSPAPKNLLRETIRYSADGERKYIRYYDGRGHFGHVRLRLIPHPGEVCRVTLDAACSLPEECCQAIQDALTNRFDLEPRGHLGLIGLEARLTGGSYLDHHSYPEAYAHAARMAFDEAFHRACPMIVEPYIGVSLLVEFNELVWILKALRDLLGEAQTTQRVTDVVHLKVDLPVRLVETVRSMGIRIMKQFPVPSDERYRPLVTPRTGDAPPDVLGEWT
jgi:translation elongation factor EF-G